MESTPVVLVNCKIDLTDFLVEEAKNCFPIVVAIAREGIWKTKMKVLKTGTFITLTNLVNYFIFHLKRMFGLERRCVSTEKFKKRWKHVERKSSGEKGFVGFIAETQLTIPSVISRCINVNILF